MKKTLIGSLILTFFLCSIFGQSAYNYKIDTVNAAVNNYDQHWFGSSLRVTPAIFVHDPASSGPVLADLGTGILFQSGAIKFDLSLISTVGLSGVYSDLTGKPTILSIQRARAQTDASGNYTWTYPVAYGSGVIPVISALSETASTSIPQGVQIIGVPTNTSCVFKVLNLPATSVLGITVIGVPTGAQAYLHITAQLP